MPKFCWLGTLYNSNKVNNELLHCTHFWTRHIPLGNSIFHLVIINSLYYLISQRSKRNESQNLVTKCACLIISLNVTHIQKMLIFFVHQPLLAFDSKFLFLYASKYKYYFCFLKSNQNCGYYSYYFLFIYYLPIVLYTNQNKPNWIHW